MVTFYKKYVPYLFILPALVLLTVFFFIPFFQTFILSFNNYSNDIYNPVFAGINNYITILKSPLFLKVILNTFLFLICVTPFLVVFPLILAILLNQKIRGVNVYKVLIYLPVVVSIVVCAIAFKWLYMPDGVLNYFISFFKIKPIGWLSDPNVAMYSVAALTIWKGVGYYMMIYLAALMGAPKELYEACDIDGADTLTKHMTVTVPYLMPTIALVATISAISALKVFVEIYVMTRGGPLNSTKTIVYYIYERAFENLDLGIASAAAVVLLVIVMGFSIINILFFERKKYQL